MLIDPYECILCTGFCDYKKNLIVFTNRQINVIVRSVQFIGENMKKVFLYCFIALAWNTSGMGIINCLWGQSGVDSQGQRGYNPNRNGATRQVVYNPHQDYSVPGQFVYNPHQEYYGQRQEDYNSDQNESSETSNSTSEFEEDNSDVTEKNVLPGINNIIPENGMEMTEVLSGNPVLMFPNEVSSRNCSTNCYHTNYFEYNPLGTQTTEEPDYNWRNFQSPGASDGEQGREAYYTYLLDISDSDVGSSYTTPLTSAGHSEASEQ